MFILLLVSLSLPLISTWLYAWKVIGVCKPLASQLIPGAKGLLLATPTYFRGMNLDLLWTHHWSSVNDHVLDLGEASKMWSVNFFVESTVNAFWISKKLLVLELQKLF